MIEKIQTNSVRMNEILPPNDLNSKESSSVSEIKNKKHKGMLPADAIRLNYVEKGEESLLKEKVRAILTEVKTAIKKSGFDPRVTNILMLYIAFAQNQMDQNDKLEAGWMDQQHVQNLLLEDSAKEQKKVANESTQGRHISIWKAILIGIAVIAVCAIVGFFTAGIGIGVAAGVAVAAIGVGAPSFVANSNPNAAGVSGVTENGPDQGKLTQIGILNSFWNLLAQKANQNIQTGTQLNIVNTSSSNTQQGQQASQVISEWGQMSRFQVAR
ncbi:MAG TPA: hypothetical protein VGZ69_01565 [Candidatus Rhabdochlamydia sp.]|jgi:hypothetical protein|nr:hypothetical protein [Candidatus Rhabdochlamydia sp.]